MSDQISLIRNRLLWWACLPLLPGLAAQGRRLRRSLPVLPAAPGPTRGSVPGSGDAFRLAVIGESTAVGVGAAEQRTALAGHLARNLAVALQRTVHWQVAGRSGLRLAAFEAELLHRVAAPVEVAVVVAGVNDVLRLTSERRWTAAAAGLVPALRDLGARHVIFTGVPPLGRIPAVPRPLRDALGIRASLLDAGLQRAVAGAAAAAHVPTSLPLERGCLAADGFHPSSLGYRHWAKRVAAHLIEALGQRWSAAEQR